MNVRSPKELTEFAELEELPEGGREPKRDSMEILFCVPLLVVPGFLSGIGSAIGDRSGRTGQ